MSILFFDTETTGFPDFNCRARDPKQPHIVQLATIVCDDDGKETDSWNVLIKPNGWEIPEEASKVHGITTEKARAAGIDEKLAAQGLLGLIRRTALLVAHNITFDKFIARIAMRRFDLITDADDLWWKQLPTLCTMRAMTDICQIPSDYHYSPYRWPKLIEAYRHCFGVGFEGQHDALSDVRACAKIYFWLKKRQEVEA